MHRHLLDLPAELQLKIIQQLLRDEDKKTDRDCQEQQDEPVRIPHHLINWSCTCSYFRNLLAPDIFRTTILVNDERSGASLNAVAKSPHGVLVKELHFVGSALGEAHSNEAAFSDTKGILPDSVETLLCDLQKFPNLERLSIEFDCKNENSISMEPWEFPGIFETDEEAVEAEGSEAWRALMSRTYSALAQNKSPHFKHLEIRQLIWEKITSLSHATSHDFLGHFEQFTLSINTGDNGAGWNVNTPGEYPQLMDMLEDYFFNHLTNVTNLAIKGPKEGNMGLDRIAYGPLSPRADQMPRLKTLHLEYISASPELTNFLVGHKSTLEVVTLRHCYTCPRELAAQVENGIRWSELFTALVSARPAHLRHFTLIGYGTEYLYDPEFVETNEQVRTIPRGNPARILFPYAFVDDKSGMTFFDEDETVAAFLNDEDLASWTRLMALVEENNRKRGAESQRCVMKNVPTF